MTHLAVDLMPLLKTVAFILTTMVICVPAVFGFVRSVHLLMNRE